MPCKLNFDKSKNDTPGGNGSVLTDNTIGKIQFRASGGEYYNPVSAIHSETTKDMTDSGGSGSLIFSTANNQTTTRERMIIHPEGTVQIGTKGFPSSLNVTSTTRISSTLSAGGVVYLNSDLSVNSKLYVSHVDSNINFNKSVNINGRTNIDNNLSVGKKTFLSDVNIRGTLNVSKSIIANFNPGIKTNNLLISSKPGYINFSGTNDYIGTQGFGIRVRNDGVMEFKNQGSSWAVIETADGVIPAATNKIVNAIPVFSNTDGSVSGQQNLTFDGSKLNVKCEKEYTEFYFNLKEA